jgi:hypothetical protein
MSIRRNTTMAQRSRADRTDWRRRVDRGDWIRRVRVGVRWVAGRAVVGRREVWFFGREGMGERKAELRVWAMRRRVRWVTPDMRRVGSMSSEGGMPSLPQTMASICGILLVGVLSHDLM